MAKLFDGETKTYQGADNGNNLTVDGNKYYDNTTFEHINALSIFDKK